MTTGGSEDQQESGKEFREKFEANLVENEQLRGTIAEQLGVNAQDLKGIPADQIVSKAQELKSQQEAQERDILRKHLGLAEDADVEEALAKLKGGEKSTEQPKSSSSPFASTGALGGTPPGTSGPPEGVSGPDRIRWATNNRSNKSQ